MKLERFAKIRGYRLFKDFAWPTSLEDFGRFNLIYGWNGTGKTTLSSLLKAVQTSTAISEGEVDLVFDGTQVSGSRLAETALPPVRVFNRETVARSVFESSGEALSHLPPVYVFGEESAEKQRQLDALKSQLPTLTDEARRAADQETKANKELNEYAANAASTHRFRKLECFEVRMRLSQYCSGSIKWFLQRSGTVLLLRFKSRQIRWTCGEAFFILNPKCRNFVPHTRDVCR